jgi:hypothetical protein
LVQGSFETDHVLHGENHQAVIQYEKLAALWEIGTYRAESQIQNYPKYQIRQTTCGLTLGSKLLPVVEKQ